MPVAAPFDSVPEPHDEWAAGLACSPYALEPDEARERVSAPQVARLHVELLRVWTVWLQFGPDEAREQAWLLQVACSHAESLRVWTVWLQFGSDEAWEQAWLLQVARSHVGSLQV